MESNEPANYNESGEEIINQEQKRIISGFWRRILAMFVDSVILGLIGLIIGILGFSFLSKLGFSGRLFGFAIALSYFGIGNSSLRYGQTPGKKLLRIRVVDGAGQTISVGKSVIRYVVLGAPFFLNNAVLPYTLAFSRVAILILGLIIFGVGGSIIYLYIFNRRTRQSLHDLAVGSYVVKAVQTSPVDAGSVWRGHLLIVGIWMTLTLVFGIASSFVFTRIKLFPEIIPLHEQICKSVNVKKATVFVGKSWSSEGDTAYMKVNVFWKGKPEDFEEAAKKVVKIVIQQYPRVFERDVLAVTVVYGYDIGISSAWWKSHFNYSPQRWEEMIADSNSD